MSSCWLDLSEQNSMCMLLDMCYIIIDLAQATLNFDEHQWQNKLITSTVK